MWNTKLYKVILDTIVKEGTYRGKAIKNKEDLYRKLSTELYVSYDTVKGWTRQSSKGPGDKDVLNDLEKLLNTTLTTKDKEEVVMEETEMNKSYSNFVKEKIYRCYELMLNYLAEKNFEDEAPYCEMRNEIIKMKVCIPKVIFEKITAFIDENLDPIVYDHDNYFSEVYTEDFGYRDEDGVFHFTVKNEEEMRKHVGLYFEKLFELMDRVEEFGMKEIYPVLTV